MIQTATVKGPQSQSLVVRRAELERVREALRNAQAELAAANEELDEIKTELVHAKTVAEKKWDQRCEQDKEHVELQAELDKAKKDTAGAKKTATAARKKADEARKKAVDAQKAYEDALDQVGKTQAGNLDALKKAADEADKTAKKAEKTADEAQENADAATDHECDLERQLAELADLVKRLSDEHVKYHNVALAKELEFIAAEEKLDAAKDNVKTSGEEHEAAQAAVDAATITSDTLSREWDAVSELRAARRTPKYLSIRIPTRTIDTDAERAINSLNTMTAMEPTLSHDGRKYENNAQRQSKLQDLIHKHGIATEVASVTKELNRRRMTELQRRVLAITYFESLLALLRGKSPKEIRVEFKDTNGIVEEILIYQQNRTHGPLKRFARELVRIIKKKNNIRFGDDDESEADADMLVADQLYAKLLN